MPVNVHINLSFGAFQLQSKVLKLHFAIQGPIVNRHQSTSIHSYIYVLLQKALAKFCRCREMKLCCAKMCENASPVIFHMPTGHPSTNFSKTDILTISKHLLWVNCKILISIFINIINMYYKCMIYKSGMKCPQGMN